MTLGSDHASGATVLIVDDDLDIVQGLQDLLEHDGYQVRAVTTGAGAVISVKDHHYDAVVLDLGLPDRDGLSVLQELQELDPKLPVVILTAFTRSEKTIASLTQGAFAYLTKPYNRDELRATLQRAIGVKALAIRAEKVETALTASEERFRSVVQSANDAIILADDHGRILSCNKAAERMFGYRDDEVMGQPLLLLMPVRYRDAHQRGLERITSTGETRLIGRTIELEGLRKDGTEFPIELSLASWTSEKRVFYSGIIRDTSQRRHAEAALRQSEERLRLALDAGQMGIWDWDIQADRVIWSDTVYRLLGCRPDEFAGTYHAFLDRVHPEDRERLAQAVNCALNEDTDYSIEHRVVWTGGTVRWLACKGQVRRDASGKAIRMLGTVQDVTERRQGEKALRSLVEGTSTVTGKEFFRLLVRHLAAALQVRYALATTCVDVPPTRVQVLAAWMGDGFGRNLEYELAGTPCEHVLAGQLSFYPTQVQALFPHDAMLREMGADSFLGTPFLNSAGAVIGHLAVLNDKPMEDKERNRAILKIFAARAGAELERLRMEEMVHRLYHRLTLILNSAGEGIYGLDLEGRATFVNPAAARMLGWEVQDLVGRPVHAIFHHSKQDGSPYSADECPIYAALTDGAVHAMDKEVFWRKDGSSFPVEYISTPIREHGEVVGAVVVFKDITERKRAEETLRESEERFRQVAEHIREVFWMSDPEKNTILYISPGYEEIWGRTCESLYASPRSWLEAVHPDDRDRVLAAALTKQVTGEYCEEYRIIRPDGSVRWILDRAFPVRNASGTVYRIAGLAEDITNRKSFLGSPRPSPLP